jgi:CTP synthase (UTP-ammonia lyase)
MALPVRIGLVGDFNGEVPAHRAIPHALALAANDLGRAVGPTWLPTEAIRDESGLAHFDGLWCVPGSPYRSIEGALRAIRFAREQGRPFLGTCGGFQHAILEFARDVLGWEDAEHAETAPDAERPVVTPLACALVEASDAIRFVPGSRIAAAYGLSEATERYRCRYGINPAFQAELLAAGLRVAAVDAAGEVRAVELEGHPFFVATLFQPERAALTGALPPLVGAFVKAAAVAAPARAHD